MSFDVGINIKSQADLGATKQTDDAIKQLGKTLNETKGASEGAAAGVEKSGSSIELLHQRGLGAHRAIGMFADTVGQMGEAGHIAAGGLLAAATGVGIVGIGIGIASTAIALFVEHLKSAAQAQEQLRVAFRAGDLGAFEKEIDAVDQRLLALGASSDALRGQQAGGGFLAKFFLVDDRLLANQRIQVDDQKKRAELVSQQQEILAKTFGQTTLQVEFQTEAVGKSVAEQEELANESRIVQALQRGLANASQATKDEFIAASTALKNARIAEDIKKTTESIDDQVRALQYEQAAVGKTGEALIMLQTAQKIDQVNVALQRAGHKELAGQIDAEIAALGRLQVAASRIQSGQQGINQFQQQYGVQDPMTVKIAGAKAAELFKVGFDELFKQHGTEDQQIKTFIQFIQQQLANGVPDIQELLLYKGMSSPQLESLKFGAKNQGYGDLIKQLDANIQAGQQWGKTSDDEFKQYQANTAEAGKDLQGFQKHYEDLTAVVAKGIAMRIDVSAALGDVDEVVRRINGIPDVIQKTLVFDVQYTNLLPGLEREIQRGTGLDLGARVYP
jgi:hypothetical protein